MLTLLFPAFGAGEETPNAQPKPSVLPHEDLQAKGARLFFKGEIESAIGAWDEWLAANPDAAPYHWQRGIALYYAGRFADGRKQFESHVKVNPQDVENSTWHFICVAAESSLEEAQKKLMPVTKDSRVPMAEVLSLFAGNGTESEVLAAAANVSDPESKRDAFCYAHLYLGLFYEAQGKKEDAKAHLVKSATEFSMPHYMGKVAMLHCKLRGWLPK